MKKILLAKMKYIVVKPSHFQGFLCNFKIEGDISISLLKKWSWSPCRIMKFSRCVHTTLLLVYIVHTVY